MRVVSAVALLLAASTALAQPYVGDEVRSWTMEAPVSVATAPTPALSIVADGGDFAIAWSAGAAQSRVSVARLDGSLRVTGEPYQLPAFFGDGYDAVDPQLVVTPSGYAVAWRERKRSQSKQPISVIVARLTKAFDVASMVDVTATSPDTRIRLGNGSGDDVTLAADPIIYTIRRDGSVLLSPSISILDDAVVTPQHVAWVVHTFAPASDCITTFGGRFCRQPAVFTARVLIDSAFTDAVTQTSPPATLPSGFGLSSDGANYLLTWIGSQNEIFASTVGKLAPTLNLGKMTDTGTLPVSAGDGQRWLVVWQSKGDILGSMIDADGRVHDVVIAGSSDLEQHPTVIAVRNGVFVVGYEISGANGRQLAGRYVTVFPPHHRPGSK